MSASTKPNPDPEAKPPPAVNQCGTCGYAQNRISYDNMLHCRRWPPVTVSNPGHPGRPIVAYNDWCGEYQSGTPADPLIPLPVNIDIPHAWQEGNVVNCTMGNWTNVPSDYAYQWKSGSTNIGAGGPSYLVTQADIGRTVTCVVTATNGGGSVSAPPSNAVTITDPALGTP